MWISPSEPFGPSPLVLVQEHSSEFGEFGGPVAQHAQQGFPIGDVEPEDASLPAPCAFELLGGVINLSIAEPLGELEHKPVGYLDAC